MRAARSVIGVARLTAAWLLRQPVWLLQDVMMVAAFALILWAWGGREGLHYLVAGWLAAGGFAYGVNMVGQEVGWHRILRVLDMFVASPVTPRTYLLGVALGHMLPVAVDAALLGCIAVLLGAPQLAVYGLAVSLCLSLPIGTALGLAIVLRMSRPGNVSAVTNPISSVMMLLPPVLYPATVLPEPLRPLAIAVPTSAAAELARSLAGLGGCFNPLLPLASLLAWLAATTVAAGKVMRWGHW